MLHKSGAMLTPLFLMVAFIFMMFSCDAESGGDGSGGISKISWHPVFQENGLTIIPGFLKTDFGGFEVRWVVGPNRTARLVTLESPGTGELPLRQKKLFLWFAERRATVVFQEWPPMVNVKEPVIIRPIVKVSTADLFSVLPKMKLPPAAKVNKEPQPITWGRSYGKKGARYLPGLLQASFGRLNIYWKKEAGGIPELITLESPGAGELPPRQARLYIRMDEKTGLSIIFQERQPLRNQGLTSYLWPLATVRTGELMAGFRQVDDAG
jgi:hypothetical protein